MDRPKRNTKPTIKVLENNEVDLIKKMKIPKDITPKVKQAVAKAQKIINVDEPRTLHLDIPAMDLSNPKLAADYGRIDHPFWRKYFFIPDDMCTDLMMKSIEMYEINFFPASFMEGIPLLDIKPEYYKPMKQAPLYSKLINGDYEIASSKSDKNIANTVKFFRNNFISFAHLKDEDDLSWIVSGHRAITLEILHYSFVNKSSISTIKSKFNALTRLIRIAYDTKAYPLYEKYSSLVLFLRYHFDSNDWDNELNDFEKKKFIDFSEVLKIQKRLQTQFESLVNKHTKTAYDLNNDLLLISLYSLIPPLRNEVKSLKFTTTSKTKGDWILFIDGEVRLDLNEIKKRHDGIQFNLSEESPELARLLKESYDLYPRENVFTLKNKYPQVDEKASEASLDTRLSNLFKTDFPHLSISVNSLRSSFVSYANMEALKQGKLLTVNEKEKIAKRMRSSRRYLDEAYLKILPIQTMALVQPEKDDTTKKQPIFNDTTSPYDKQLQRNKTYYDENKKKVLKQQKEYQASKTPFDKSRVKMLHYLNTSPNYESKMKPATFDKYKFVKVNGKWT